MIARKAEFSTSDVFQKRINSGDGYCSFQVVRSIWSAGREERLVHARLYLSNAGSSTGGCRIGASGLYLCARCAIALQSRWDGLCSSSCLLCLLARAEPVDSQPRFNNLRAITASPLDRQQSSPVRANSNDHGHSGHWEWMKISIPSLADTHRKIALFSSRFQVH